MEKTNLLRIGGLRKRWLQNTASVVIALGLVCVMAVTASFAAYYYATMESDMKYRARTTTDFFADYLERNLKVPAVAHYSGDEFDLLTGECTAKGVIRKVTKISDGRRKANAAFDRLLAAGKRLLDVIGVSKGLSNKELAKFTDQINALCDKYLRK